MSGIDMKSNNAPAEHHPIIPRERLNFDLGNKDIPKFWFDGDPFKTRMFDAMSVIFPPGERYFMTCVRDFRDKVTDKQLLEDIKNFNRQEGQHTMVHSQYNDRLREQGIDVDGMIKSLEWLLFDYMRGRRSREWTLAQTSALEHFTAIGAFMIFGRKDVFEKADPRLRAMYTWHALEEVEHKGVAYDVMQQYAGVGYFRRILTLFETSAMFIGSVAYFMHKMFKADGFGFWQRVKLNVKGFWWLFKPGGLLMPMILPFLRYFVPGYHPWDEGEVRGYQLWLEVFKRTGDPVAASDAVMNQDNPTPVAA
jgi:predicted metal-dependent hydrolase